ncbi:MAG: nucleotidyltransferase domain-containing protein [Bacteroidota bacterium]
MSDPNVQIQSECATERAVLCTLFYFEFFSYPLTAEEVWMFAGKRETLHTIRQKLVELSAQGRIFQFDQFYQSVNNASWAPARLDYNRRADQFLPIARRMGRLIGAFPFVRSVYVSGSLSKHSMRPDGDIDFFIITAPGRLWLSRTLLVLFKKILLFNSHKYFCVNYFIDTDHLLIEEQNLFTATEMVTLLPMYDTGLHAAFIETNQWAWAQFPNFQARKPVQPSPNGLFKRGLEWLLSGRLGAWLDVRAMTLTVGYWRRKFGHFDSDTFEVAMKSRRYVSKHHPLYFQKRVLDAYAQRIKILEEKE